MMAASWGETNIAWAHVTILSKQLGAFPGCYHIFPLKSLRRLYTGESSVRCTSMFPVFVAQAGLLAVSRE